MEDELESALEWLENSDNRWRLARVIAELMDDVEEAKGGTV